MTSAYNGRVLGVANIPSFEKASGIWRPGFIAGQLQLNSVSSGLRFPPSAQDPNFSSVALLIHCDDISDFNHSGGSITDYSKNKFSVNYTQSLSVVGGKQDSNVLHAGFGAAVANIGVGAGSSDIRGIEIQGSSAILPGASDFVIEGWFRFENSFSSNIWDARKTATVGPALFVGSTGTMEWDVNNVAKITAPAATIAFGTAHWYHIAYARAGTSGKLFVDGAQVGSTFTDSNTYDGTLMATTSIVGNNFSGTSGMKGYCAEFRITIGAARYTTTFTPPAARFPDY